MKIKVSQYIFIMQNSYGNTIKLFLSLQDSFYYCWQFMEVNFQAEYPAFFFLKDAQELNKSKWSTPETFLWSWIHRKNPVLSNLGYISISCFQRLPSLETEWHVLIMTKSFVFIWCFLYSCLENPLDTVHRVAKSRTRLSDFTLLHEFLKYLSIIIIILNQEKYYLASSTALGTFSHS